jgi:peroxiredoxin
MIAIGDPAPKVTLKLTDQEKVSETLELSDAYNRGTTVLYFFPAAFTGVCTKSSCELRDDIQEFGRLGAQIFGVSTDMPFSQRKFIQDNDINYPLLSDWNKEAIKAFGIVDDNFGNYFTGVAKRSLFVIKDSKISFKWIAGNSGQYPPFDELKIHLQQ